MTCLTRAGLDRRFRRQLWEHLGDLTDQVLTIGAFKRIERDAVPSGRGAISACSGAGLECQRQQMMTRGHDAFKCWVVEEREAVTAGGRPGSLHHTVRRGCDAWARIQWDAIGPAAVSRPARGR